MDDARDAWRLPDPPGEPPHVADDRADLAAAAAGDRAAFHRIYERHVRVVYRHAFSLVSSRSEAEEATQDVFTTLWAKIDRVVIADRSLLPWLLTTSRFVCLNRRRAATRRALLHREGLVALPADPVSTEDRVRVKMLRAAIDEALAELSEDDYTLYLLCIEEGLSYEEAARSMGVSHGSVRNRLSRLRARLRDALTPRAGDLR